MPEKSLKEKYGPWAVVTGASEGIGQAFAHALAAKGLNLVLVARREVLLKRLATQLQDDYATETKIVVCDLAAPHGMASLLGAVDTLDIGLLVAGAGFGSGGDFLSQQPETEVEMLEVNCRAVLEQAWHFGHRFQNRGCGGMVLFSSVLAFQGTPRSANYSATKAYIQSLAEGLHAEWQPLGIDVIACAPGPTQTGFAKRANLRMGQTASPDTVAKETLAALGKRTTVRPGWLSKLLGWSLSTAPRSLRVRIIGQIMQGMTAHQTPKGGQ